jgi:NADH dehydrogenase [ubiquinone] 1 alpha subcomplex assembly factor 3
MDIFSGTPEPATSVDACTTDGFHLNNGVKVTNAAVLLAGGEAWAWKPWLALSPPNAPTPKISDMLDPRRGTLVFPEASLSILAHLHPKPDLLLVGTGARTWALEPITRKYIMETLGIRVEITDTANATAAYNLLAKERGAEGGSGVGGCFLPIGWKGPQGAGRRR